MRLHSTAAFWALLASTSPHGLEAKGLRRKLAKKECTINAIEALGLEGNDDPEMIMECELSPDDADGISGISVPIDANPAQIDALRKLVKDGKVTAAHDKLDLVGSEISDKGIKIPPGLEIASIVRKNEEKEGRRRLAVTTGELKTLLVKVTDSTGKTYPDSPTVMR